MPARKTIISLTISAAFAVASCNSDSLEPVQDQLPMQPETIVTTHPPELPFNLPFKLPCTFDSFIASYQRVTFAFDEIINLTGNEALSRAITGLEPAVATRTQEMAENLRNIMVEWPNKELREQRAVLQLPQRLPLGGRSTSGAPLEHPLMPWHDCIADAPRVSITSSQSSPQFDFSVELSFDQPPQNEGGGNDILSLLSGAGEAKPTLVVVVRKKNQETAEMNSEICRKPLGAFDESSVGGMTLLPRVVDTIASCALAAQIKSSHTHAYELLWGDKISTQHLADSTYGIEAYASFIAGVVERGTSPVSAKKLEDLQVVVDYLTNHVKSSDAKATAADYYFLLHASVSLAYFGPKKQSGRSDLLSYLPRMSTYKEFGSASFSWFKAMTLQAHGDLEAAEREWNKIIQQGISVETAANAPIIAMIRLGNIERENANFAEAMKNRDDTWSRLQNHHTSHALPIPVTLETSLELERASDLIILAETVRPVRDRVGMYRFSPSLIAGDRSFRSVATEISRVQALSSNTARIFDGIAIPDPKCKDPSCKALRTALEEQLSKATEASTREGVTILRGTFEKLYNELQRQCQRDLFKHEACSIYTAATDDENVDAPLGSTGEDPDLDRLVELLITTGFLLEQLECRDEAFSERTEKAHALNRLDRYANVNLNTGALPICEARWVWKDSQESTCDGSPVTEDTNEEAVVESVLEDVGWTICPPAFDPSSSLVNADVFRDHGSEPIMRVTTAMLEYAALADHVDRYYELADGPEGTSRKVTAKLQHIQGKYVHCGHRGGSLSKKCQDTLLNLRNTILEAASLRRDSGVDELWAEYAKWKSGFPGNQTDERDWSAYPKLEDLWASHAQTYDDFLDQPHPRSAFPAELLNQAFRASNASSNVLLGAQCERVDEILQSLQAGIMEANATFDATGYAAALAYFRTYDRLAHTQPCGARMQPALMQYLLGQFAARLSDDDEKIYGGASDPAEELRGRGVAFKDVSDLESLAESVGSCRTLPGRSPQISSRICARRFAFHVLRNPDLYSEAVDPALSLAPALRDAGVAFRDWIESPKYGPTGAAEGLFWLLMEEATQRSWSRMNDIFDMNVFPRYLVALKHFEDDPLRARRIVQSMPGWYQDLPEVLALRGWIQLNLGNPGRALRHFRQAARAIERQSVFYGHDLEGGIARAQMELGIKLSYRDDQTVRSSALLTSALGTYQRQEKWMQVALVQIELGNDTKAKTVLEDHARPSNAKELDQYALLLAMSHWGRGERGAARKIFEQHGGVVSDLENGGLLVGRRARFLSARVVRNDW